MDLDIEMGDMPEPAPETYDHEPSLAEDILQPDEPDEPGEVADEETPPDASKTIVPTKLHLRGLDTLHTDDIKAYVTTHFGPVDKVEWIDDTSANLAFSSEPAARDALAALSALPIADASALAAGESLPAKPLPHRPEIALHLRFAVASDRKQAGAALRSRYYLLHPEHDPEERRRHHRRQLETRARYRDRDRRRRGRDDDDDEERESFEASMYDDKPRRPDDDDDDDDDVLRPHARDNSGKELFANRGPRRDRPPARDRSASPRARRTRDDDHSSEMEEQQVHEHDTRRRSNLKPKELFPAQGSSASRLGGGQLDHLEAAIGSAHLRDDDLPKMVAMPDVGSRGNSGGLNIRGMAAQRGSGSTSGGGGGFAIKGSAGASAKELFPGRFGAATNAGKELLSSKRRQRAEDLFS